MRQRWATFFVLVALGCGLMICCYQTLHRGVFDVEFWHFHLQRGGVGLFLLAYIILTAVGVPGTLLTVSGGVVFGLWWGTVWSVIGATLGAIAAFTLARYLLHDWVQQTFSHHPQLQRFQQAVQTMPLMFVLAIRFAPISPFNVVNFLLGLTPIALPTYALGTALGIIPGCFAYTWLGVGGQQAFERGAVWPLLSALGLLSGLSLLPWLYQRWRSPLES